MSGRSLSDRVALVLGAGAARSGWGIGQATAAALADAGAIVVATDIREDALFETKRMINNRGGRCEAVVADATLGVDTARVVDTCLQRFGRIDVLHNNIGVVHLGGPVEMSEETWLKSMQLNVGSAFLSCKHVLPVMERQGLGVITTISSIAGLRWVGVGMIGYSTFKGALIAFTQSIALQYGRKGIRANVIVPGRMDTPMMRASFESTYPDEAALVAAKAEICPTGVLGDAWDVAHAAVFLASDEAKYITGAVLPVDGGVLCQS